MLNLKVERIKATVVFLLSLSFMLSNSQSARSLTIFEVAIGGDAHSEHSGDHEDLSIPSSHSHSHDHNDGNGEHEHEHIHTKMFELGCAPNFKIVISGRINKDLEVSSNQSTENPHDKISSLYRPPRIT